MVIFPVPVEAILFLDFYSKARKAAHSSGTGIVRQFVEILLMRYGPQRLGIDEYYLYQLYSSRYTLEQKRQFCGWRLSHKIDSQLNDDQWRVYANDKIEFARAMDTAGMRTPKILALFGADGREIGNCKTLSTADDLMVFLRDPANYPIFLKPAHGTYGRGGYFAHSFDSDADSIRLGDGSSLALVKLVDKFSEDWTGGYLLQQLLLPHPEVVEIVGQRLSSLRVVVVLVEGEPQLFRVVWKLPTGNNMSDNFMHGELGNLIAAVDIETGAIASAVGMKNGDICVIPEHPDTGVSLPGIAVPLWPEVVHYCQAAARLFPGLALQHWDIALTPQGPVALEVNVEGSIDLHQIAGFRGVYDGELRALLDAER